MPILPSVVPPKHFPHALKRPQPAIHVSPRLAEAAHSDLPEQFAIPEYA